MAKETKAPVKTRVLVPAQVLHVNEREKRDGSGSYYIMDGVLEQGGVFETYVDEDIAERIINAGVPSKLQFVYECRTYQGKIAFRLADIE